jgi:hypothetical protein
MFIYDYFYDAQMKRFLQQIVRAFSGVQYQTGRLIDGQPERRVVPCRMATTNRMVAALMRNNSDNTLLTVPLITVYRTNIVRKPEMESNRAHVDTLQVTARDVDTFGDYTSDRGNSYTVQRHMPNPYEMTVQVDIWTSNMDQKDQIMEQFLVLFGRDFDIQNSDNVLDWTALSILKLNEIQYSSRSIPIGTEDEIDVATLTYSMGFWLNPPAKLLTQQRIETVRVNVDARGDDTTPPTGDGNFVRVAVSPDDLCISINRGQITLLDKSHSPIPWSYFSEAYKRLLIAGISEVRVIKTDDRDGPEIVGVIHETPEATVMDWQVDPDTLPAYTLPPINGIIRPLSATPGIGTLPAASNGQRYLVAEDIGNTAAWGNLNAKANEIIQYQSGAWHVVSHLADLTGAIVLNSFTGSLLKWNGSAWVKAIDGIYGPGYWHIVP